MRTFGRVETSIWQNWKFHELSDDEKWLWIYLISCPHGNALGCFVLPVGYVASDIRWPIERASEGLSKLFERGLIERDEETNLVRIVGWFGHNRIESPNVAKGILSTIAALPKCAILANAIRALIDEGGKFAEALRKDFERSLKGLPKPRVRVREEPEPEIEPEIEPESQSSLRSDSSASADPIATNGSNDRAHGPVAAMVEVWNHELGELLSRPRKIDKTRQAKLCRRLQEDFNGDIEQWRRYCQRIRGSPHLIGENDRGWRADLDWCIEPRNVSRILEGRYDRRERQPDEPPQHRPLGLGF